MVTSRLQNILKRNYFTQKTISMKTKKKILTPPMLALFLCVSMYSCQSSKSSGCGYWGCGEKMESKKDEVLEKRSYQLTRKLVKAS